MRKSFLLRWRGNLVWTKGGCIESISIGNYAVSSNLDFPVNILKIVVEEDGMHCEKNSSTILIGDVTPRYIMLYPFIKITTISLNVNKYVYTYINLNGYFAYECKEIFIYDAIYYYI